jgi:DamX protein
VLQRRDSPKFWLTLQGLCTSRSFLIGVVLLLLFSGLTFIFQRNNDSGDTPEQQTINIALPAERPLLSDLQQREEAQQIPIQEPEPILVDEMTEPVFEEVYEDPVITGVVTADAIVTEEKRESDELLSDSSEIEAVTNEQTSLIEGAADITRSPGRTRPLEAKVEHVSGIRSSEWLKQQVPDHYVLQLIGVHDQTMILRIIDKHKSMKEKLSMFLTVNQNKPWYVLVYGLYKDRDSAVADVPNLPADVQTMSPWPRQIVTIHKALE